MRVKGLCQYYVEGNDEKKLLTELKTSMQLIVPGKIETFNVVQERFSNVRLMQIKENTTIILVYDTDTNSTEILKENIARLKKCHAVKEVICIPQVANLEEELVYCCDIRKITELLNSRSQGQFKHDLIIEKNLKEKLISHKFNINKLWERQPQNQFHVFENGACRIKL
ncbi:MAG: hypothetical protein K6G30_09315 [Acetatifactor sp.]|nr:hypothetical protein [Acetatifactor sp.]